MEENNEKFQGTEQYWLEVQRIGSLLFQNIKNGDNYLKSIIGSIIETPFLCDIESLSGDVKDDNITSPFTSWLLEALLKASACHTLVHLKTFYTVSQSRLLISTYERDLFAFEKLITSYVKFLEKVMNLQIFPSELIFLLPNDFILPKCNKILSATVFYIKNKNEQIDFIIILLEVIKSVLNLIIYHCPEIHYLLWKILTSLLNSNFKGINFLVLPLICEMFNSNKIFHDEQAIKSIFKTLPAMIEDSSLIENNTYQHNVCEFWTSIKLKYPIYDFCNINFAKQILKSSILADKKCILIKNFLINEFSYLLFEFLNVENSFEFLEEFSNLSFLDKMYLCMDSIVQELILQLKDKEICEYRCLENKSGALCLNALDISKTWAKIIHSQKYLFESCDPGSSSLRLKTFCNLAKFSWKILHKLDVKFKLFKLNVIINFFGNLFYEIIEKLLLDLSLISFDCETSLEVTLEALTCLLNLPESQNKKMDKCKKCIEFLMQPFASNKFDVPRFSNLPLNSNTPVLFLKCLQTFPLGVPVESCISIFFKCSSFGEYNKSLTIQALKSVPFLFLSRKTSPSRLISDLLLPVALQENKELLGVLIDSTADLVCALAGTCYVIRGKDFDLVIECQECFLDSTNGGTQGDLPLVESHLIKLISQISLQDNYIKKKFLKKLPRLTKHMTRLFSKDFLEKFILFLSDPDEEIRQLFCSCIKSILGCSSKTFNTDSGNRIENLKKEKIKTEFLSREISIDLDLIFEKLEKLIHLSMKNKEQAFLQTTLLETLTNIACFPDKKVLSKSIRLLLLFIGQSNVALPPIFMEISAAHKTTPLLLYYSYRPEISHFLGNLIAVNRIQYSLTVRSSLSEILAIFKGLTESRFASGSENYIIPIFVLWATKYSNMEELLEEWSSYTKQLLPIILSKSFQNIYTYILLNESADTFEKSMFLIEKLTNLNLTDLVLHSQKLIINQLLFNYHRANEKVLIALKKVIGLNASMEKEAVAESLEPRFVGYLLFIVSKFVKEINVDSEKVQAMHSLISVIELMGKKYVTPVARKVVATLQTILKLNSKEHLRIQLKSWEVFILTVEANELGPLLATIVVSLLPFLNYFAVDVSRLFTYLIVINEEAVKDFLPSLIFLPEHPLLTEVKSKLQKYISFEEESLKNKLLRETSLALHETVGVQIEGLKALQKSVKKYSAEIQNLIIGSDEPDPCIKTLLEGLIVCCSDSDPDISTLAASCLGQLGAVDPGLLPRKPKLKSDLPLSVHDPEFAFLALTEISRGFQNARNSVDMDAFAIAIQELLKMYQIGPTEENGIWNRFPLQIQNLMTPMLSSRFKVQTPKREVWPDILFGSKEANTYMGWASLWASKLIGYCKDERAVFLFKVCEPSLKRDTKVLLFFLQYILLQAVIRDSSVHDSVIGEIEAVISCKSQDVEYDDFGVKSRPIRLVDYCGYPNMRSTITHSEAQSCAMTVFLLIDFLHSWLRIYRSVNCSLNGEHLQKRDYIIVKDFLQKVDYLQISISNYEIQEYPRAIMYLEDVISTTGNLTEHIPLLSKAYALYGDLDSVAGSSTFQKTAPKVEDLLLSHQVSGQLEDVRIVYEKLGKDGILTPTDAPKVIQCYLNLGEPYGALSYINSFTNDHPDMISTLSEVTAESLIKLGDFSQLEKFLEHDRPSQQMKWFVLIGNMLLSVCKGAKENVLTNLSKARLELANSLKKTGLQLSDYQQGYFCLVKLQILNEIERVFELLCNSHATDDQILQIKGLVEEWNLRSAIVQSDQRSLEPLLSMRRVLLKIMKDRLPKESEKLLNGEIAKYWVKSAEIARKSGCFHQAYNFILNAEQFNIPLTFIEKAQLFWEKNDQDLCLFTLSRGIKEFFPEASEMKNWAAGERIEERKMCAEAKLLFAIYSEETSNCDHNMNMTNYQSAFEVCRQLEKSEAFLAQCLDRVVMHLDSNEQEERKICELKVLMVHHFGKSLMYGCEYIYQTVPRMLSIWLDLGEKVDSEEKSHALAKMNKIIQGFLDSLPPFVFMTALPQLLSRLGHPNRKVFLMLKNILVLLLKAFPQQCLWAVQAVAKGLMEKLTFVSIHQTSAWSSVSERVQRYNEFIQDTSLRSSGLFKLISDFTNLCDKLNKLTNRNLPQETAFRGLKVSSIVRELPQLLASEKFSPIIIPITRFCSISLPRNVKSSSHEPFPKQAVYITGIEDEVTVLQSLQRPRKISFRGSDGKLYDILCKPKDDLRRDGRLMEFNNIVNMYLHRDPESRLRGLHIRTYVVTPLGEGGGLLEWVPNLIGLRQVLIKLYKQFGKYTNTREIKRYECHVRDSLEKKRSIFIEKLLVLHPPLFPEWFRLTFPDPSGWYIARESYVRTTAVMSMVGYILGLGDRHGENILFDSESGDTVHVDFNCLFNKGEKFDWKERVPFRLTHNMVAAMGPFGVEGTFRKSCEISLRVLRSQTKTLMSVLTPFAYDPFGSWGKNKEIVQNERDQKIGEAFNELSDIEQRLNGSLRVKQKQGSVYLSVEGQARSLIVEATDIDNLCQMYFGWGAYL